ncbi:MAG: class I SAM-dependent methyltransferase [Spirochaetales bacterium]|nr:class I SAM-dependent methyltransferase [Spirochaetales bacterium]
MKAFDRTVPFYDGFMQRMGLYQSATLINWLNLKGTEKVLDLGGGTGYNSHQLSSHCKEVVLLDESQAMVKKARKYKSFTCVRSSALNTPFQNNSFDIVVMADLFHHIKNQVAVIREIWRLLKPGGLLLVQDFVTTHPYTSLLRIFESLLFGILYFKSPRKIRSIISSQGFILEREEAQKHFLFQLWRKV